MAAYSAPSSVYISPVGGDVPNCGTSASAGCASVSYALGLYPQASTFYLIAGTYALQGCCNVTFVNPTANVMGLGGVANVVCSNFPATSWTVSGGSLSLTAISFSGFSGASKGGAIYIRAATVNTVNCTFTGNKAAIAGGAVYADSTSAFNPTQSTFSGNIVGSAASTSPATGGAIALNGQMTANECNFTGNYAMSSNTLTAGVAGAMGGAAHADALTSLVSFTSCIFANNFVSGPTQASGGAISVVYGATSIISIQVFSTNFTANFATSQNNAYAGALYIYNSPSQTLTGSVALSVVGCSFQRNSAIAPNFQSGFAQAGAVNFIATVGTSFSTAVQFSMVGTQFVSNNAIGGFSGDAGAMYIGTNTAGVSCTSSYILKNCNFFSNVAQGGQSGQAGAIDFETTVSTTSTISSIAGGSTSVSVVGCLFSNNTATGAGQGVAGAVYMGSTTLANLAGGSAGSITATNMAYSFDHCQFVGNTATSQSSANGGDCYALSLIAASVNSNNLDSTIDVLFEYCQFINSSAAGPISQGGSIYGGLQIDSESGSQVTSCNNFIRINYCTFSGAVASGVTLAEGGGVWVQNSVTNAGSAAVVQSINNVHHFQTTYSNCQALSQPASSSVTNQGGAIYSNSFQAAGTTTGFSDSTIYSHCSFEYNSAAFGGAIYSVGGSYENLQFVGNTAAVRGGAVYNYLQQPGFSSNTFIRNFAPNGGAVYAASTALHVTGDIYINNTAAIDGGAAFVDDDASQLGSFRFTTFQGNQAGNLGGALSLWLGQSYILNATFVDNQAALGGGLYLASAASTTITGTQFAGNNALFFGGAAVLAGIVTIATSIFKQNSAVEGGALNVQAPVSITSSVFASNNATNGGAVAVVQSASCNITGVSFTNNYATAAGGAMSIQNTASVTAISVNAAGNTASTGSVVSSTSSALVSLVGSSAQDNLAQVHGGAIAGEPGSSLLVSSSTLSGNSAGFGGAVYAAGVAMTVTSSAITSNTALFGGGLYSVTNVTMSLSQITSNSASSGGGLYYSTYPPVLQGCTVTGNVATAGSNQASVPTSLQLRLYRRDTGAMLAPEAKIPNGVALSAQVFVLDAYNQISGVIPASATLQLVPVNSTVCDFIFPTAPVGGMASFNFTAYGQPGQVQLAFAAISNMYNVASSSLFVGILDQCNAGFGAPLSTCGSCDPCPVGTYNLNNDGVCQLCPKSAQCVGGYVGATQSMWILYDGLSQAIVVPCAESMCLAACNATLAQCALETSVPYQCYAPSTSLELGFCEGQNLCAPGRTGFMCAACLPGYALWNDGCVGTCHCISLLTEVACQQPRYLLVLLLLAANWALTVVLYMVLSGSSSALTKTLVYFGQVALLILGPNNTTAVWLGIINYKPTAGTLCPFPRTFLQSQLTQLLLPVISLAQLILAYLAIWLFNILRKKAVDKDRWLIRPISALLLSSVIPLSTAVVTLLNCRTIQGGASAAYYVLAQSPNISCNSQEYFPYRIAAIALAVLFVVGMPLSLLGFLFRNRGSNRTTGTFKDRYGYLFEVYRTDMYYWEFLGQARRIFLVGLAQFDDVNLRQYLVASVCLVIAVVHVRALPYKENLENLVETIALWALVLISYTASSTLLESYVLPTQIFMDVMVVIVVAYIAAVIVHSKRAEIRAKLMWLIHCIRCRKQPAIKSVQLDSMQDKLLSMGDESINR